MRVVLVEDDPRMQRELTRVVEALPGGGIVLAAESAQPAIDWLARHPHGWDLLIVDMFLKQGHGFEVLRGARKSLPHQRSVMLSNYGRDEVDRYVQEAGADRFFDKSFELDDLARYYTDYVRLIAAFDLDGRVARREIDEVWLFGPPYAGFWESTMAGPGAFWCNSPAVARSSSPRRYVIMGFNYERDVGCMLENFGHRTESIMSKVYERRPGERNLWERFCRYDKSHPGRAECGNVHFAPSSQRDYDWGNPRPVLSRCDTRYRFPDLGGEPRTVRSAEWGGGDMRAHHLWWFEHLPRALGETDGVSNNWWPYIVSPDLVH